MSESSEVKIVNRALDLLKTARYLTLAVVDREGPWAATINYVVSASDASQLVFYSARQSRHARAATEFNPNISASIYRTDLPGIGIDGLQILARMSECGPDEVPAIHSHYYATNFADPRERAEWLIPTEGFTGASPHRFYKLDLQRVWLLDAEAWDLDKVDRRREFNLATLIDRE